MQKKLLKRAWAVTHTDRLKRNIEKLKAYFGEKTELMCVVKANCYGHGIEKLIPCMQDECDINWFAVSNLVEAQELRDLGVTGEILILGYTPPENAPELVEYDIIQAITCEEYAKKLARYCPVGEKVRAHVAIDTGMMRLKELYAPSALVLKECLLTLRLPTARKKPTRHIQTTRSKR